MAWRSGQEQGAFLLHRIIRFGSIWNPSKSQSSRICRLMSKETFLRSGRNEIMGSTMFMSTLNSEKILRSGFSIPEWKQKCFLPRNNSGKNLSMRFHPWNLGLAAFFSQGSETLASNKNAKNTSAFQKASSVHSVGKKSEATLLYLVAVVVAMVGLTYAAVPLYRKFCQSTGYGGTVQRRETVEEKIARHAQEGTQTSRDIVVQFNADVADGMPWKFIPSQREVKVKPGESALAFYTAENFSSNAITGVSTYNVTPMKAAIYFNKIQCFCFEEQKLLPGEKIDMPVFFYIDPEFEADPKMKGINNMILSYTFFKVED
eukprot:TRINITY_DN3068_c0_g1_i1.p1 TRINITY_DN3068_c0_g1~~TRINITY_DN3068_c0_g1_i1.p1  ORF type:complete len:317 (+),score=44.74 TRINITY_DN3068_c0_g1_i1:674-1624(+)